MLPEQISPTTLIMVATLLAALSGVPLLVSPLSSRCRNQFLAIIMLLGASCLGVAGSVMVLISGKSELFALIWTLPFGEVRVGVDPLSAWFLIPIYLIPACSALYARSYWPAERHPRTIRKITFFFGLMTAAMSAVVLARDGISFLFAWEFMALAAYFLITTEDEKREVNQAGTLYMITTHIGTLGLFVLFPVLNVLTGSWNLPPSGSLDGSSPMAAALFLAALFAFGMKAGIMPLHIWLPAAHANAPSHVSAVMSGVILKIGIYGLLRTLSFFHSVPLWWGGLVLLLGMISGLLGVIFALGQHDLKRLLAYHSIENIGIIVMGIGISLIGQATGSASMMMLGMGGALLHVLNHAVFKALLFLGAGSVIHAVGTREIDLMGGVARRQPYTALLFGVGAVAICGLPPLNGFVSELLVYMGLFHGIQGEGPGAAVTALAAPALAMIGGLAVACFVKVYGIVFLGAPRHEDHSAGHEAGLQMLLPMALLAVVCAVIGLAPRLVSDALQRAGQAALPPQSVGALQPLTTLVPFSIISVVGMILLLLLVLLAVWYKKRLASSLVTETATWGCGYQRPTVRMQYSASSFAQMLNGLFAFVLRPHTRRPTVTELFPPRSSFESHVPEAVLDLIYIPALERLYSRFLPIRKMQNGVLQQYVLYILITLVVLLVVDYF